MAQRAYRFLLRLLVVVVAIGVATGCDTAWAQSSRTYFDRRTLDSLLAPIALYPDSLLAQVLMAATYPLEVGEAARWSRARPGLSGDAAVRTSEGWDWDPSVRSLLAFPLVLDTMDSNMTWTEDLGEAFLAQHDDVMDSVQHLRRRAYEEGTLRSNDYVRVIVTGREISIEPASPQVVHVPYYDPRVVYGTWWWPSRPPVLWARWPGYVDLPSRAQFSMYWGPGVGLSAGFFFGGFIWSRHEVRVVNVNPYYYPRRVPVARPLPPQPPPPRKAMSPPPQRQALPGVWRHDESRRRTPDRRDPRRAQERPAPPPVGTRSPEIRREPPSPPATRATPAPRGPLEAQPGQPPRREAPSSAVRVPTREPAPGARPPERDVKPRPAPPPPPQSRPVPDRTGKGEERTAPPAERRVDPADRPEPAGRSPERSDQGARPGPERTPQRAPQGDRPQAR